MKLFFFDVVRENMCVHDFSGRYLRSVDEARDVAEIVSFDLACTDDKCAGSEIQVRDTGGALLFAMNVTSSERAFA